MTDSAPKTNTDCDKVEDLEQPKPPAPESKEPARHVPGTARMAVAGAGALELASRRSGFAKSAAGKVHVPTPDPEDFDS